MSPAGPARPGRGTTAATARDIVRETLGHYAARGLFSGLSEKATRQDTTTFRFGWLTSRPLTLIHDANSETLSFRNLLPGVGRESPLLSDVAALVAACSSRALPAHRRIDRRRVVVGCSHRNGGVWLALRIKGPNAGYAVKKGISLVSEIFTMLRADHPQYLAETFGIALE
ncbi:MAG: hypothetical protein ACT4QD_00935 [Acidobacteriota bacterium]